MTVELRVDNSSAIELTKNPAFHSKTKHIDVRYHYIQMSIEKKWIKINHVPSKEKLVDIIMKALGKVKFFYQRARLRMSKNIFKLEGVIVGNQS